MKRQSLRVELRKLSAVSDKLMMQTRWYPLVIVGSLVVGIITLTKLFL